MAYKANLSTEIVPGSGKIMFWGATATRKTETVLRYFPHVLVFDSEGNSDMCIGRKEIPPFLQIKTKDPRVLVEAVGDALAGKLKFPDGSLVETVCFDSWTVFWNLQTETAGELAVSRARRYKSDGADEATPTMRDWGIVKRPMKKVLNMLNNSSIRYIVQICRAKDLTEEKNGVSKVIGEIPEFMKGSDYDQNLILHFMKGNGTWEYEVTKVQGSLDQIFPLGGKGKQIPFDKLFAYFNQHQPGKNTKTEDEDEIISSQVESEIQRTQPELIEHGKQRGLSPAEIGAALKAAGFKGFDPSRWDAMVEAINAYSPNGNGKVE